MAPDNLKNQHARRLPEFLTVGRILRPHGVRGGMLVEAESDLIRDLYPGGGVFVGEPRQARVVKSIRQHRGQYILYFEDVLERTKVEPLRGASLAIPYHSVSPLPEGTYFHWQIIGMDVESDRGDYLGRISKIIETGANDVYVVEKGETELLLPAIEDVVLKVDLENHRMTVHLLPGLSD